MAANEFPKIALITGGTRSIGFEISRTLAQDEFVVVMNYFRDDNSALEAKERIVKRSPQSCIYKADVSNPKEVKKMFTMIKEVFGRLDVLVNNVGPWSNKDFINATDADWHEIIDGNLSSAFYCIRSALPLMRKQKSGVIINIGAFNSELFPTGDPYSPIYGIAKAGVALMSRNLAFSEGVHGIRANTVNVGLIRTDTYQFKEKAALEKQINKIPLGHFGEPIDVANAIKYLVSSEARYVNGAIISINGGMRF